MSEKSNAAVAEPPVKTQTAEPRTRPDTGTKPRRQPPYAVIVENDEDHSFEYVTEALQKVCGHEIEKANELTKQIDLLGEALVWSGTMELAELKRDQLRGLGPDIYASKRVNYPLGVRIEPLPQ